MVCCQLSGVRHSPEAAAAAALLHYHGKPLCIPQARANQQICCARDTGQPLYFQQLGNKIILQLGYADLSVLWYARRAATGPGSCTRAVMLVWMGVDGHMH